MGGRGWGMSTDVVRVGSGLGDSWRGGALLSASSSGGREYTCCGKAPLGSMGLNCGVGGNIGGDASAATGADLWAAPGGNGRGFCWP
jgi:hypothetical protein